MGSRSGLGPVAGIAVRPLIRFTLPVFITIFVQYLPLSDTLRVGRGEQEETGIVTLTLIPFKVDHAATAHCR
jgi:hypothetical protein